MGFWKHTQSRRTNTCWVVDNKRHLLFHGSCVTFEHCTPYERKHAGLGNIANIEHNLSTTLVQSQSSGAEEIFFKNRSFPRKWNKHVMVTTQLSNSGEVHFWYEVIHDIHGQVSSFLFRRRRSSKETLAFTSLLHQRDSQYPPNKKQ